MLSFGRDVLTFTDEGTFLGLKSECLLGAPLPSGTFSRATNYDFSGHGPNMPRIRSRQKKDPHLALDHSTQAMRVPMQTIEAIET
jgi:hypothetical protein